MHSAFIAFCKALERSAWGAPLRETLWGYPFVQLIHFTGLSIWIATTLAVDLRLIGVGKWRQTAAELSKSLFSWNWIGFVIVVTGGFLLFSSTATTYVVNRAFEVKLGILAPTALLWHVFVQKKASKWGALAETPAMAKLAGSVEILLWLSVVTAAVLIPNY